MCDVWTTCSQAFGCPVQSWFTHFKPPLCNLPHPDTDLCGIEHWNTVRIFNFYVALQQIPPLRGSVRIQNAHTQLCWHTWKYDSAFGLFLSATYKRWVSECDQTKQLNWAKNAKESFINAWIRGHSLAGQVQVRIRILYGSRTRTD